MSIGLFGGTFNPVHNAHLLIARHALRFFRLDEVVWIPSGNPPWKHEGPLADALAPARDRLAMVRLATCDEPKFSVSAFEVEQAEVFPERRNYTVRTVSHFRDTPDRDRPNHLFWIMGVDALAGLANWHQAEELVAACQFIAVTRPGCDAARVRAELPEGFQNRVHFLPIQGSQTSSTEIREKLARNKARTGPESEAVDAPPVVRNYIRDLGLYLR